MQLTYVRVKNRYYHTFVDRLTNDLDGAPYWSLTDVPFDFGYNLIYLEITNY
jgi:hypothetical protein